MKIWINLIIYIFLNIYSISIQAKNIDNIVAIVNNHVVLNSDVQKYLFLLNEKEQETIAPFHSHFLRDTVIRQLILENILLDEAHRINIRVTDAQVDKIISNIAIQKNITVLELKNNTIFNSAHSIFTYNDYYNNIKKQITIKILQDYILNKRIYISDEELNHFFSYFLIHNNKNKKIKVSYILLPIFGKNVQKNIQIKKILAKNIINQIDHQIHFEYLYNKYKKSKNYFIVNHLPRMKFINLQKMFLNNLNITKKGEVLGPFLEKKGFYILKVDDIENKKENIITEFHIQHCLIKFSPIKDNNEVKKNIFKIYNDLKQRRYNFDYVTKNLSDDINLSSKKGDLGWIEYHLFDDNFKKALIPLKNNDISYPVKSDLGWHLLRLLNRRKIDQYYKIEKNKAYRILLNYKMLIERDKWIKELVRLSYIHILNK